MNKALFLDRDGVINRNEKFLNHVDDLEYMPGIFNFCHEAKRKEYKLIIVTNQAGIGYGLLDGAEHAKIMDRMISDFERKMCPLTDYFYCWHTKEKDCICRKPKPGMLQRAVFRYKLDITECHIIGDMQTDIEAGIAAGIPPAQCHLFNGMDWPNV